MGRTTVRIAEGTRSVLRQVAQDEGRTMQAVLDSAVEEYRRRRFLEGVNRGYAALRNDPGAATVAAEEQAIWDRTLGDGLPGGERWSADGRALPAKKPRARRR